MTARTSDFLALSKIVVEHHDFVAWLMRLVVALMVVAISLLLSACFPEGQKAGGQPQNTTISNAPAKRDRLDSRGTLMRRDVRVETTATVIPTSAPEPVSTVSPPPPLIPADEALRNFFEALAALDRGDRQEPVTILHLGDEHIAADRITAELRAQFQARFGDAGRGLMAPGVFRIAGARISREGDWRVASSAAGDAGPFGLTGVRLIGRNGATLNMTMPEAPFDWAELTFATGPDSGDAYVAVGDKGDVVSTRTTTQTWQRIKINAGGSALSIHAVGSEPVRLLSWRVVRENPGVRYVNLGVPNARIETAGAWSDAFVKADLTHLSPDLIIFGYGTNSSFDHAFNAQQYAAATENLIARMRAALPDVSVIIVGPPDLATLPPHARGQSTDACRPLSAEERANYDRLVDAESPRLARWHPPIVLAEVRRALRSAASRHAAFFWDWSEAMGGPCSIHAWVHATPPLAAPDHRNLTPEGAQRTARALYRDLMLGFERYRLRVASAKE